MSDEDKQNVILNTDYLAGDVRTMILQTRENVARVVNKGITLLYWRIGKRIQTEVLGNQRAEFGNEIVSTLSRQLGWSHQRRFASTSILYSSRQQAAHLLLRSLF